MYSKDEINSMLGTSANKFVKATISTDNHVSFTENHDYFLDDFISKKINRLNKRNEKVKKKKRKNILKDYYD